MNIFENTNKKDINKKNDSLTISDTLFVLLISALAYGLAYYYEIGFMQYYHIPGTFIELSTEKIVVSIVKTWARLFPVFLAFNILPEILPQNPLKREFIISTLFAFTPLLIIGYDESILFVSLSVFVIYNFLQFILPIFTFRKIKGYENKLIEERKSNFKSNTLTDILFNKSKMLAIILLLFVPLLPYGKNIGEKDAQKKVNYTVVRQTNIDYVVVDNYNDKFIIAPVNLNTKIISTNFIIVDLQTQANEIITIEQLDIGPLSVK